MRIVNGLFTCLKAFRNDDRGVALTEYIVLLGVLVGGVLLAVGVFGENLAGAWEAFAEWVGTNAPTIESDAET